MIIINAPMKIAQGEPFNYEFTVEGQDWTGYTGTALFKRAPKAVARYEEWTSTSQVEPILEVAVTAQVDGDVLLALTPAQTAIFPALPRVGYFKQAVCEFSLTNGSDVQKFQVRVLVAAELA